MNSNKNTEYIEFFSKTFIFKEIPSTEVADLIKLISPEKKSFVPGETIYSPSAFEKKIGFVFEGECQIEKFKENKANLPLNKISKYDSFGILAAFACEDSYPSQITAKKSATIIFITKSDILTLIKASNKVSLNLILFMSDRISFLNKKIATFSSDTVEQKFSNFLLNESKKQDCLSLSLNISKIATTLNVGRASLYRAIDSLSESKIIELENKKIIISDLEGLERISK